ncbi:MAG: hydantoinase B/oxoprolinase family protein [Balneolaceae bacterium]|nr:hydantoinase B/oxoprolinase family protein [Balneolaceae bacterium]
MSSPSPSPVWKIWIDTGGTFTDAIGVEPSGWRRTVKVLSSSALRGQLIDEVEPGLYRVRQQWEAPDEFIAGFRFRTLGEESPEMRVTAFDARESLLRLDAPLPPGLVDGSPSFEVLSGEEAPVLAARLLTRTPPDRPLPRLQLRLATTKGTNALLENRGGRVALLVNAGYRDLLRVGDQTRPDLFALQVKRIDYLPPSSRVIEVEGRLDADGGELRPLQTGAARRELEEWMAESGEEVSVAVSLMHSYRNPAHEKRLAESARKAGATWVTCGSELSSAISYLPRTQTAVINARLKPVLERYLRGVREAVPEGTLHVMSSAGGLTGADRFQPKDSLLSGPAGGVVGAATAGRRHGHRKVISFDMGGTSTDVARYDHGYDYVFRHAVGGYTLNAPALSIETVAAGGGSICGEEDGTLFVGPQSAGASPGPACYGDGGPLTVTDVNLLLGRLQPENFSIPIDRGAAERKLQEILERLKAGRGTGPEAAPEAGEILEGFLRIANERMADAVRRISLRKGYDPAGYALVAFGGAGAQHACAIASQLGAGTVLVPPEAGLLSAWGLGQAVIEEFAEAQVLEELESAGGRLPGLVNQLAERAACKVVGEGVPEEEIRVRRRLLFMRLEGQDATLEIEWEDNASTESLAGRFREAYRRRYGHWVEGRAIEVESVRVAASGTPPEEESSPSPGRAAGPEPFTHRPVRFGGEEHPTPVHRRGELRPGQSLSGPALVLDPYSTVAVEPGWEARVAGDGTLKLERSQPGDGRREASYAEAVEQELFTNRFTSIAGEMGEMLRRTALSVNIKERRDFSCALLSAEGELIVNAPHIPVHLGALGLCVRRLMASIAMEPGDVVVTNHPAYGGSHLPDITVVTPVYGDSGRLLGFAASRAHHAEIGGSRPGSMPPGARSLAEEGVVIPPDYLVRGGEPRWEAVRERLAGGPWPSRAVEENVADLQAAVAANHRGVQSLAGLARREGEERVRHYMKGLKELAARKTRAALGAMEDMDRSVTEYLDDGTPLQARLVKRGEDLTVDFEGTGEVHPGNLNATPAIVQSVIMYVLRVLVDEPLPLNEGLLEPLELRLPTCLLNPGYEADPELCPAVVGGNTEVSQRLTDLLLKPFGRIACSQGTMNNVLFGNEGFGYYETVGGGTGAGAAFDGADTVHHHMTNTAGTDPEILEHRYPVRLERYGVRKGSGGKGRRRGGDGIVRELSFLEPVSLSVLTQHRRQAPYGLQGGEPGACGEQRVIRVDGREEELGPVDGAELEAGDRFQLLTPGGGGYGKPK